MNEVKPEAGVPPLLYCKRVNDKGGPCHAPDCNRRSGCMPQLKRQQHTGDGKTVNHQDHFRCTITCSFCGKPRHYADKCHKRRRKSGKLKRPEAERQKGQTPSKGPKNGDKGGKGGGKGAAKDWTPNDDPQRRSLAPATWPSPARLTERSVRRGIRPPQSSLTPRRGDWPVWPNRSWLRG